MARVRNTSIASFRSAMESLRFAKTQKRCLEFIHENPGCSRNEVERGTGMRQASVSGRVRDLLDKEMIYEDGCKKDPVTGEANNRLWCSCCEESAGFSIEGRVA